MYNCSHRWYLCRWHRLDTCLYWFCTHQYLKIGRVGHTETFYTPKSSSALSNKRIFRPNMRYTDSRNTSLALEKFNFCIENFCCKKTLSQVDEESAKIKLCYSLGEPIESMSCLPVQLCPSPSKPLWQVQLKEPLVFLHEASLWQVWASVVHSSISEQLNPFPS